MATIEPIDAGSHYLTLVKKLWRANSETLGFLPDGAFDEYASKGGILIARDRDALVGYLLYRLGKSKATIAHLCVDETARGKGYPEELVRHLVVRTNHLAGIDLRCRRDFPACRVWQRLGFTVLKESPGRAADGSELTHFWLDFGHADLFTSEPRCAIVVLDANVFVDLAECRNEESQGLLADWLQDSVEFFVTSELNNDINRARDPQLRRKRKQDALRFEELKHSHDEFMKWEQVIRPLFPVFKTEQDESDFRHLVRAVAGGAAAFVTRDDELLRLADEVYHLSGLRVLRPAELIGRIDELVRESEYQRFQVAGTRRINRQRASAADDSLIRAVAGPNDPHWSVRDGLNTFFAAPQRFSCFKISDNDGSVLAFYVIEQTSGCLRIPLFRVCRHKIAGTLARCILTHLVRTAVGDGKSRLLLCESIAAGPVESACADLGFLRVSEGHMKLCLSGAWGKSNLGRAIDEVGVVSDRIPAIAESLKGELTPAVASEIEHMIWPGKIVDGPLLTYLLPIRAGFAAHLFDEHLATQGLFGADVDLALNPESVYYRSACQRNVKRPGRILWYVSDDDRYQGTKSIRACSRIAEVQVGAAKRLFRQFQRLGVYEWPEVLATAKGDPEAEIMAVRFHDTELLRPIRWNDFQSILRTHGIRTNLESPVTIPARVFAALYALAFD
ncbi:MAG TPA: GNAT family N-acetyltransferase [Pirellulales bacterium]|nr:GNAT family N-acetyltransferase [Pirellulales bacterium]